LRSRGFSGHPVRVNLNRPLRIVFNIRRSR
jgi:hypothetical protein